MILASSWSSSVLKYFSLMLIGLTWLFIMKIFSVLLTLSALVTVIRADLSKYYDSEDYSGRDYDYYEDQQYQDMAEMAEMEAAFTKHGKVYTAHHNIS